MDKVAKKLVKSRLLSLPVCVCVFVCLCGYCIHTGFVDISGWAMDVVFFMTFSKTLINKAHKHDDSVFYCCDYYYFKCN